LTLLPVLYMASDFGGKPLAPRQARFAGDPEILLRMVEALRESCRNDPLLRVGLAPHSLRAVPEDALREVCAGLRRIDATAPLHLHVAEQRAEVAASLAHCGKRPVEWLLEQGLVDAHCCLVHATHLDAQEVAALAGSGAVVGLCPSTEANLGDGFFPLPEFIAAGGAFGIGSDSNVATTAFEELRLLEYGQRLRAERRNLSAAAEGESTGTRLYQAALAGGARASGQAVGALAVGFRADFLVLDGSHPALLGVPAPYRLDALVFASHAESPIRDVYVAGRAVVSEGRHAREDAFSADFAAAAGRVFD
jgi:formimidoylglutamate deiminase